MDSHKTKVENVISVCTLKDIYSWMYASNYLKRFIDAIEYHLIIPEKFAREFEMVTPKEVTIHYEERFAPELSLANIKAAMPEKNKVRAGWYYQQLLKIKALAELGKGDSSVNVIWDADTVPYQTLRFVANDQLVYYIGTEHHIPYFETIKKLINKQKITNFSFISQCFPARKWWVKEFLAEIEQIHHKEWHLAILDSIDLGEGSGFSEYETLGTYFAHRFQSEMLVSTGRWERSGYKVASLKDLKNYLKQCDGTILYAAYETWDPDLIQMTANARSRLNKKLHEVLISKKWSVIKCMPDNEGRSEVSIIEALIRKGGNHDYVEINSDREILEVKGFTKLALGKTSKKPGVTEMDCWLRENHEQQTDPSDIGSVEWSFREAKHTKKPLEKNGLFLRANALKKIICGLHESWSSGEDECSKLHKKYLYLEDLKNETCIQIFEMIDWRQPPEIIEIAKDGAGVQEFLASLQFDGIVLPQDRYVYVCRDLLNNE